MANADEHRTIAPIVGPDDPRHFTDSGIEIGALYDERDLPPDLQSRLGEPGEYPYTRGCTGRCTASSCGRCASTPATRRPRSPTSAIATCCATAPPDCRWRLTCRP